MGFIVLLLMLLQDTDTEPNDSEAPNLVSSCTFLQDSTTIFHWRNEDCTRTSVVAQFFAYMPKPFPPIQQTFLSVLSGFEFSDFPTDMPSPLTALHDIQHIDEVDHQPNSTATVCTHPPYLQP